MSSQAIHPIDPFEEPEETVAPGEESGRRRRGSASSGGILRQLSKQAEEQARAVMHDASYRPYRSVPRAIYTNSRTVALFSWATWVASSLGCLFVIVYTCYHRYYSPPGVVREVVSSFSGVTLLPEFALAEVYSGSYSQWQPVRSVQPPFLVPARPPGAPPARPPLSLPLSLIPLPRTDCMYSPVTRIWCSLCPFRCSQFIQSCLIPDGRSTRALSAVAYSPRPLQCAPACAATAAMYSGRTSAGMQKRAA